MGELRPWQIVVLILAAVVLSGSILWQCNDESKIINIADRATVVDVVSGEVFETSLPTTRAVTYPAKNPSSGVVAVFPAQREDGKWVVPSRFRAQVQEYFKGKPDTGKFDAKSGEVAVSSDTPKRADVF